MILASLNVNLIEFGVSILILALFIALCAVARDAAGQWANLFYLATVIGFTVVMCLFGWKLAPLLYE
jgi:hypothetical protein